MKLFLIFGAVLMVMTGTFYLGSGREEVPREDFVLIVEESADHQNDAQKKPTEIYLKNDGGILQIPLEEYLVSVVMSEMPASFAKEALKAQAVAARTFAAGMLSSQKHTDCTLCSSPSCCQAWNNEASLQKKYGDDYADARVLAAQAVEETKDQVLIYDGKLIEAVYYSCSGGSSEAAVAVWGSDVPYLQSVPSPGEENATKYRSEVRVPFAEFKRTLKQESGDVRFSVIPENWIKNVRYTEGGGVESMTIGGVDFKGTKLRNLFSLNSTLFDLTVGNGEMVFSVKGYGHRVGMSQYGADAMARSGCDYREILGHYYTGVTIKKLSRTGSGQFTFAET